MNSISHNHYLVSKDKQESFFQSCSRHVCGFGVFPNFINCTAFVGEWAAGIFHADATGFFTHITQDEIDFGYFVTAAHVIWPGRPRDEQKNDLRKTVFLSINRINGEPDIMRTKGADWVFHEDKYVDLCTLPLARGWTVCRFHGARGGAPKGKANGAYKHGLHTKEAQEERRWLSDLLRQYRKAIAALQYGGQQ
jgi:hypothetical protein